MSPVCFSVSHVCYIHFLHPQTSLFSYVSATGKEMIIAQYDYQINQMMPFKSTGCCCLRFVSVLMERDAGLSQHKPNAAATAKYRRPFFQVSFHQPQHCCPAYHFPIMQIGRKFWLHLYFLLHSSAWQRELFVLQSSLFFF